VYEALDRSGFTFFLSPFANGGLKLASSAGLTKGVMDQPTRFQQSSWLSGFLGPSFQLIDDTQSLGTSLAQRDWPKVLDKAHRLAPYSNLFYLDMAWRMAHGTHEAVK
jgi:hypothetical protein